MTHPLRVRPVPIPADAHHPGVPYPTILPQHEFSACLIAPKGSGKTTLIANLLDFYKGYFHQIIVFSPTIHSDEKWDYIRKRPLRKENTRLKKFLDKAKEKQGGSNAVVGPASGVVLREEAFDPRIPDDAFMTEYDEATLADIMRQQLDMIQTLEKLGGTKHLADRLLFIFDDLVGSTLFSQRVANPFKRLNTNLRHHSASLLMVSQAYKELPKTVRTNTTCLMMFEIQNEAELRVIYEENPLGMDRAEWDHVYAYCTDGDYNFMYINYKRPKKLRIMKNFDQVVFYAAAAATPPALDPSTPGPDPSGSRRPAQSAPRDTALAAAQPRASRPIK